MTAGSRAVAPDQTVRGTGPDETGAERSNRNLADLIQELRVATLGVQLFGFLLSLPFTVRFTQLNEVQRNLYRSSLVCAASFASSPLGALGPS